MRPILQKNNINYKLWILYVLIFLICIAGIGVSIYMQYFRDEKIGVILGITDSDEEDAYNELKNNFSGLFTNNVDNFQGDTVQIKKIKENFNFVAKRHSFNEEKEDYTLDVTIPIINIDNEYIKKYNQHIEDTYKKKVDEIKVSTGYIYNVRYKGYIQNNILSLIIYSELKEQSNNQQIMIETFNYNLVDNKEASLEDILKLKDINISEANNKIKKEIKEVQDKNDSLIEVGYDMYKRDLSSDMYEVKNADNFFIGENGNVYVVFAYGNFEKTSEMDIIIFMNN